MSILIALLSTGGNRNMMYQKMRNPSSKSEENERLNYFLECKYFTFVSNT